MVGSVLLVTGPTFSVAVLVVVATVSAPVLLLLVTTVSAPLGGEGGRNRNNNE
jgi:hypothetical protein